MANANLTLSVLVSILCEIRHSFLCVSLTYSQVSPLYNLCVLKHCALVQCSRYHCVSLHLVHCTVFSKLIARISNKSAERLYQHIARNSNQYQSSGMRHRSPHMCALCSHIDSIHNTTTQTEVATARTRKYCVQFGTLSLIFTSLRFTYFHLFCFSLLTLLDS